MRSGRNRRIELNLRETNQLFNSMDPSPFNERDLDADAEAFIFSWAQEYRPEEPLSLRIYLEDWPKEDPNGWIRDAIHHYFGYRAKISRLEFRRMMKQGRTALAIGLVFLAACITGSEVLLSAPTHAWTNVIRESLTIGGWVAMWRPMETYLYDWWPLRRKGRVYERLSKVPIEVVPMRSNVGHFAPSIGPDVPRSAATKRIHKLIKE